MVILSRESVAVRLQAWKMLTIVVMASLLVALAGSGCDDSNGISRDEAIMIATERVEADGIVSLDDYVGVDAKETEDCWYVYWDLPPGMLGGGPNVFVDKFSGAITQIYYTQ